MADTAQIPVNGTFPAQHVYPDSYSHVPAPMNSAANFQPAPSSTPSNAPVPDQKNSISKDEVGWYFVEQYYTNMSRSPEKLHLFYSRRSQFVFGTEAESVPVAVGQKVSSFLFSSPYHFLEPSLGLTMAFNLLTRPSTIRSSSWTSKNARSVS